MIILKFGGTSVGNIKAIQNLSIIVNHAYINLQKPIVICSAIDGITNLLQQAGEQAKKGVDYLPILKEIENSHYSLIRELLPIANQNPVLMRIKTMMNDIEELLLGIMTLNECSPRINDRLLAYGELFSVQLIASFLNTKSIPAVVTDSRKLVFTDSNFGCATVDYDKTQQAIKSWQIQLENIVPIITGFIAYNNDNETTTLGRGGADYTASIFGAALNAEEIQIWTDVDGFHTADPRLVKNAYSIDELSYREAMELSYFGAKVLYPPSLIPAIKSLVPIRIKNTFNPNHPGKLIHNRIKKDDKLFKGISSIETSSVVNIEGNGIVGMKGFCRRLFGTLANNGVNIIFITQASSEHSISFAINPNDEDLAKRAIIDEFANELSNGKIEMPEIDSRCSIIALIGENMKHSFGLSGKVFSALGENNINIIAIAQGSSELNVSMIIESRNLSKALNIIHNTLLPPIVKNLNINCIGSDTIINEIFTLIVKNREHLRLKHQLQINVISICNGNKMLISKNGESIDLNLWQTQLANEGIAYNIDELIIETTKLNLPNLIFCDTSNFKDIINYYATFISGNFSIVTSNINIYEYNKQQFQDLKILSQKTGVYFNYDNIISVGLPVIKTINDLNWNDNKIMKIEVIQSVNSSSLFNEYNITNYDVFNHSIESKQLIQDFRNKLTVMEFAKRMIILAREVGVNMEFDQVKIKPFFAQSCFNINSIYDLYEQFMENKFHLNTTKDQPKSIEKKACYIGRIENNEIIIEIQLIDLNHPYNTLIGNENIISIVSDSYQNNPLMLQGPALNEANIATSIFSSIIHMC